MTLASCFKQTQLNSTVNEPTKNTLTSSKALPITLLVIGTVTVLVAALIGIPGLLSTASSLNLPASFAWIHAIGTPGLAAILGAGGALGLSVIALGSRRLCHPKHTEILDNNRMHEEQQSHTVIQDSKTGQTTSADVTIAPFEQWQKLTDENCQKYTDAPSIAEFKNDYPLQPGQFMSFRNFSGYCFAIACREENGTSALFYSGEIQEANKPSDEAFDKMDDDALGEYNDARSNKIEQALMRAPFNLSKYIP